MAEKNNLQHISEGVGDQRHITIIKNSSVEPSATTNVLEDHEKEEEINYEQFRSFSLLEEKEEKKDSNQVIDKTKKLSKPTSDQDQNLIAKDNNEKKVNIKYFKNFVFFLHSKFIVD